MEGFNSEWSPALKQREITFTNLPPGKYIFKVTACNENNLWNNQPASFTFQITPPLWQELWFKILAILVLIGFIWFIFSLRIRQIKTKNRIVREKLEMEKNIIHLEQEAARLQMNPHFIFNSLNSIQGFISINDAVQAKNYLSKFAKLMRLILENSREEFIPLQNEVDILRNYLELEKLSASHSFDFLIGISEEIDASHIMIPPMMIQPFVENAIIHGVKKKEGKGRIQIHFSLKGERVLLCEVTDDGVGRERSISANKTHKSTGIAVTRQRLEQYKIQTGVNTGIEIIDLKDPCGTTVLLLLPYEK
ncbi:MAG: histidine kinase [Bacteroidales bacterium]|nr:histidine kinase [Bacteroidales bacterium]